MAACFLTSTLTVTTIRGQGGSGDTSTVTSTSTVFEYTGTVTGPSTSTVAVSSTFYVAALETTTTTSTSTVTTGYPVPPTACGNVGLEVAVYTNPYSLGGQTYTAFQPEFFKTAPPISSTTVQSVGLSLQGTDAVKTPYGMPLTITQYAINHRGYFYAPNDATYTFAVQRGDDFAAFWLGQNAYSSFERSDADGIAIYNEGNNPISGSTTTQVAAGSYIPLRIIYGNAGGQAALTFNVRDSNNIVYVNGTDASPYLVKFPCRQQEGRPFLNPFGSEATAAPSSADLSCGVGGVQVAVYPDNIQTNDYPAETLKSMAPDDITITDRIGFGANALGDWINHPYNMNPSTPGSYALNYRGYFFAPKDGRYTFRVSTADNWAGVWRTEDALKGWANSNAAEAVINSNPGSFEVTLAQGAYYPFRVVLASWDGAVYFNFDIFDDAEVYYASTNKPSPYLVWQPCPDDPSVPKFRPFSEEI
ncbi:hypothetical protein TWF696_001384 [Orbilia brochopaga]|uniref:PA14 domain-containing protein n=1 Tax=Orbilia brochopaga TaxID=3140254 RepID=A0AAV9U995_9PEZI